MGAEHFAEAFQGAGLLNATGRAEDYELVEPPLLRQQSIYQGGEGPEVAIGIALEEVAGRVVLRHEPGAAGELRLDVDGNGEVVVTGEDAALNPLFQAEVEDHLAEEGALLVIELLGIAAIGSGREPEALRVERGPVLQLGEVGRGAVMRFVENQQGAAAGR